MKDQRPTFAHAYLDLLVKEVKESRWRSLVPFWFFFALGTGAAVSIFIPAIFWTSEKWDISTAVYAGLLTFDGLLLALGWNAFSRIYDVLLRGDFGKYLMRNNLLINYIVHISFMHAFQIAAAIAAGVGLVGVLIEDVPLFAHRAIFAVTIGLTAYGLKQAVGAVAAMNDLVWQWAYFEANKPLALADNIVPVRRPSQ